MTRSVLDDLGEEITGIVAPVSICMALVVVLVKALNPDGLADSSSVAIATIAYHEQVRPRLTGPQPCRSSVTTAAALLGVCLWPSSRRGCWQAAAGSHCYADIQQSIRLLYRS